MTLFINFIFFLFFILSLFCIFVFFFRVSSALCFCGGCGIFFASFGPDPCVVLNLAVDNDRGGIIVHKELKLFLEIGLGHLGL